MNRYSGFILLLINAALILESNGIPTDMPTKRSTAQQTNVKPTEDDSDMLMEPDEYSHFAIVQSEGTQIYPHTTEYDRLPVPAPDSHTQAAQSGFYPPFFREAPPHGHSRPYYENTPQKFSTARSFDQTILGSGDFGVLRGGTFYSEGEAPYHPDDSDYNYYLGEGTNGNNGHGRPQTAAVIHKYTYPEEQFANFRDFADINTPSDPAFSQYVVVYANKNSTSHHPNPKNIFEQLELLDREKAQEQKKNPISKAKAKLANTKLEKKYKKKAGPKDFDYEPLLALS